MNKRDLETGRLSAEELQHYSKRLNAMARGSRKNIGEAVIPPIHGMRLDEMDLTGECGDEEAGIQQAGAETLQLVSEAIQRIQDGTYGACVACATKIPKARLNAMPHTPLCIRCQRAAERETGDEEQELDYRRIAVAPPPKDVMSATELADLGVSVGV